MAGRAALLLIALLLFPAGPSVSFAQSPDLDTLFAQLRDPADANAALGIEARIWDGWMHGGSNDENEALAKATQTMNVGAFPSALRQLDALVASAPDFPEAWNKRATLLFLMGRYDESLADIVKTLDLEPRHFGALSGRGMIYARLGREVEAIAAFKEALTINPNMTGARQSLEILEKQAPDL